MSRISVARGPLHDLRALGWGSRSVVWLQGCNLGCSGCMSKDTWNLTAVDPVPTEAVASEILQRVSNQDGLTISGGEPFLQPEALSDLVTAVRRAAPASYDILVYTGFRRADLVGAHAAQVLQDIDVLVDGPFVAGQPGDSLRGSANQTVHLLSDLAGSRYAEPVATGLAARIERDGTGTLVGVAPRLVEVLRRRARDAGLDVEGSW